MKLRTMLGLEIPVLYVNQNSISHAGIVDGVSRAGGLGFVDCVSVDNSANLPRTPHGLRVRLTDIGKISGSSDLKAILIPLQDASELARLEPDALKQASVPVIAEVGSSDQARAAERAGAVALIARGHEGPGWVSETGGLVLLQELLSSSNLPIFLQGGVNLRTAAGAVAAGAAGVALDVQLLLTEEGRLPENMRKFLGSLTMPSTVALAEFTDTPLRVYCRVATKAIKALRKVEQGIEAEDYENYKKTLEDALRKPVSQPDTDEGLLALSEDIIFAADYSRQFGSVDGICKAFASRMADTKVWPFVPDSGVCRKHGTRFPIVQGPMAHVSDNPDFLAAVLKGGGLPVLAMGNMPPPIAREGVTLAREKTGGNFGVGLIGLDINSKGYEAHLEIMKKNPPPFAVLAAGGPDLAKRIEGIGTACYLHCPAPGVVSEALKAGLRNFVFEGCESGGHIGSLGSLNLWASNLSVLEAAAKRGLLLNEVTVLFAGGVATGRAAAFIAGMTDDLVRQGLNIGLQMGTAYLATHEIVSTCAITPTYQNLMLKSDRTVVIGRTVNIRARGVKSPMAAKLIHLEHERIKEGLPLTERKELYEKDNLGALRLASKGCAIDPETATWDCPVFCDLTPEEQLDRGLYLLGQATSLLEKPLTIEQLHTTIMEEGLKIFEESMQKANAPEPVVTPQVEEAQQKIAHAKELIAVVGIGLLMPGSNTPEGFWEQITSGRSGIREVPEKRWANTDFYYDPDPKVPDKSVLQNRGIYR